MSNYCTSCSFCRNKTAAGCEHCNPTKLAHTVEDILKDTPFMARMSGDCVKCGEYKKRLEELKAENKKARKTGDHWKAELNTANKQLARECVWTPHNDYDDQFWSTTCGEDWAFIEGDPEETRINFCQGCGGKVVFKALEENDDCPKCGKDLTGCNFIGCYGLEDKE